jgi:membrane protease YdiL (CAAX protease family)
MEELESRSWWNYLDRVQQDLIRQSFHLLAEEEREPKSLADYSFIVFPAAKAYEGFLKKLFFDLGLISRTQFSGERFRIGRALNPAILRDYPQESIYEKLSRYCGGEEISARLWRTWKNSRNLVFHYFPDKENLISFSEAKSRVNEVVEAIDYSFQSCQVAATKQSYKNQILKNSFILYSLVFLLWLIYRFFFRLPSEAEETIIKPLVWILPTIILIKRFEKRTLLPSLGFAGKNFQNSLLVLLGAALFFLMENLIFGLFRYQASVITEFTALPFSSLGGILVALATALVEETFFRGYLFNRLWEACGQSWKTNVIVSAGFVLIHLPISIFVYNLTLAQIFLSLFLLLVMSFGSGLLFALTYNTVPSIVWHFLWNWQVFLGGE